MNYIITGNSGLIGTYLKKSLDKKHNCILQIDQREGFNVLSLDGVKLNPKTQKTDILYHLAAHCKIQEGIDYPQLPHINNADGIHKVMEFCRKNNIPKIVAFSSSRVLSENENPYTASKKYLENLVKGYTECYGIEHIIIRPSTVYGPIHDVTSRLLTTWCIKAIREEKLPLYGDANKTLDFTHVNDFVDGINLLVDNWDKTKNKAYNVSGNEEVKLVDVANMIFKAVGHNWTVPQIINFLPPEIAQPQRVNVDTSEIRKLGYKPKVKLEDGIKEMINFYKKEGIKWLS